jgi:hypothetical protein
VPTAELSTFVILSVSEGSHSLIAILRCSRRSRPHIRIEQPVIMNNHPFA